MISNKIDLGDYGSRGQARTAMLSLKLAEVEWMKVKTGQSPVLLLDEVLAELDTARRAHLLDAVTSVEQALLTSTDPALFTESCRARATLLRVHAGRIEGPAGG